MAKNFFHFNLRTNRCLDIVGTKDSPLPRMLSFPLDRGCLERLITRILLSPTVYKLKELLLKDSSSSLSTDGLVVYLSNLSESTE
ncbi:hypothetical protein GDO78_007370 [Eleutherodactylus coqui]|uniref:Uncharacterized protein n=1 Tax=Eleutherodactylus coqui TaxID=57060 RepID=A0A8J6FG13_ELECQ|nr:hypothetical protein GDO78_007370 [Eleutherodactylus coqui]